MGKVYHKYRSRRTSIQRETVAKPIQLQSKTVEWYTPPSILQLVRQVFVEGVIDLDPCSSAPAQSVVRARHCYTAADDGLSRDWFGRVFVNPPFGVLGGKSQQGQFLSKGIAAYESGQASELLFLLNAAVGYAWFAPALKYPHVFLHSLVAFQSLTETNHDGKSCSVLTPLSANPHGSIVVYLGRNTDTFCKVFSQIAMIPGHNCWAANYSIVST